MEHLFVVNPAAGYFDSTKIIEKALAESEFSKSCEIYHTKGPGDATDYVASKCAETGGAIRFYACGEQERCGPFAGQIAFFWRRGAGAGFLLACAEGGGPGEAGRPL